MGTLDRFGEPLDVDGPPPEDEPPELEGPCPPRSPADVAARCADLRRVLREAPRCLPLIPEPIP